MFNIPTFSLYDALVKELGSSYTHTNYNDDIIEHDDKFVVELELPGFQKSDVDMTIKKDALVVTATKEAKESEGQYIRQGRSQEEFTKTYRLGEEVDVEKIEATLADGLLTITFPKGGSAQVQKIKIS